MLAFVSLCKKRKILKLEFNYVLTSFFTTNSQKSHLNRILICFSLDFCCMDVPMLVFVAWIVRELWGGVPELIAVFSELFSELKLFSLRTF